MAGESVDGKFVWMDGKIVPFQDATIHVLSHSMQYGGAIFEGIRAYEMSDGRSALWRGEDHYRRFLGFRRQHPALAKGDIEFIESEGDTVAFTRREGNEQIVCVFNLGAGLANIDLGGRALQPLPGHGFSGQTGAGSIRLGGYGAWFGRID